MKSSFVVYSITVSSPCAGCIDVHVEPPLRVRTLGQAPCVSSVRSSLRGRR